MGLHLKSLNVGVNNVESSRYSVMLKHLGIAMSSEDVFVVFSRGLVTSSTGRSDSSRFRNDGMLGNTPASVFVMSVF